MGFAPGETITGTVRFEGGGTKALSMNGTSGTLTVGPTGVIETDAGFTGFAQIGPAFHFGATMTLDHQGTIRSQTSGRTVSITPGSFINNGTLEALAGTLDVNNLVGMVNGTSLGGGVLDLDGNYEINQAVNVPSGTLTLRGLWTNNSTISIDSSTLNLSEPRSSTWARAGRRLAWPMVRMSQSCSCSWQPTA